MSLHSSSLECVRSSLRQTPNPQESSRSFLTSLQHTRVAGFMVKKFPISYLGGPHHENEVLQSVLEINPTYLRLCLLDGAGDAYRMEV